MSLQVMRVFGSVTVQDRGRPGHMHEALAPGGAFAPELLAAANRRAKNTRGAPALEVCGELVVRAEHDILVATERDARMLRAGDEWQIASEPLRVTYLAVRGGIAAPFVLGGRGTLRSAGIGELVKAGATFSSAYEPVAAASLYEDEVWFEPEPVADLRERAVEQIRIIAGPDLDAFAPDALDLFLAVPYRISTTSDRVGTRLEGPALQRMPGEQVSRPLVCGAIEVPPDGKPIVLGPENPTTGGYPVIAVIAHAELSRFFSVRLGGAVRFAIV